MIPAIMNRFTLKERSGGVLLHATSLPGPYGAGDLGPAAAGFAGFLSACGLRWWQMLPVVPQGAGDSPYHSPSAFAGSPLLISLEELAGRGLLERKDLAPDRKLARLARADYGRAFLFKEPRLRKAFARFGQGRTPREKRELAEFREREKHWLEDYALFAALKRAHGGRSWACWDAPLRQRAPAALKRARADWAAEIDYEIFLQAQFERQWRALRNACRERGVGLIGDAPIFVAGDSADVWANQDLFLLDSSGDPTSVAGVPPDYFSKTGQLWGNPLYRWDTLKARGYSWWIARLKRALELFDALRLDHFIGFYRYWEVPARAKTAMEGRYLPGPGADFFDQVGRTLGDLPIIAEDLGVVTPEVKALRDRFGLPGMRVLQFAFGNDPEALSYQPHDYPRNCVAYTGTHDNDTTVGWFRDRGGPSSTRSKKEIAQERAFALRYLGSDGREIHWDMIRLAFSSVADIAIVPAQDLLGLGSEARMNLPGTAEGNWKWRLREGQLNAKIARRLRSLAETYGRLRPPNKL